MFPAVQDLLAKQYYVTRVQACAPPFCWLVVHTTAGLSSRLLLAGGAPRILQACRPNYGGRGVGESGEGGEGEDKGADLRFRVASAHRDGWISMHHSHRPEVGWDHTKSQ